MSAGYSATPLPRKLGIGEGGTFALVDPPDGAAALLDPLPDGARRIARPAAADVVIAFATARATLARHVEELAPAIFPDRTLWVAWPKRASKVPTDITEDVVREVALPLGLVDVKVAAIDADLVGAQARLAARARRRAELADARSAIYDRPDGAACARAKRSRRLADHPRLRQLRRDRLLAGVLRQGHEPRRRAAAAGRGLGARHPHARHRRRLRRRPERDRHRRVARVQRERRPQRGGDRDEDVQPDERGRRPRPCAHPDPPPGEDEPRAPRRRPDPALPGARLRSRDAAGGDAPRVRRARPRRDDRCGRRLELHRGAARRGARALRPRRADPVRVGAERVLAPRAG